MIRFNLLRSPCYRSVCRAWLSNKSWVRFSSSSDSNSISSDFSVRQEITMPLGDGKVLQWYKKEGDIIKYDDIYLDVDTEEFSFGMSHDEEEDALLHKIVAQENEEVREGDVLCVFLTKDGIGEQEIKREHDEGRLIYDSETDTIIDDDIEVRERKK